MGRYFPEGWLINTPDNHFYMRTSSSLREACSQGTVLEGRVLLCDQSHNLHVDCGCMKGVIPREEGAMGIAEGTVRDIALISRVNKPVCFRVTGFDYDEEGNHIALLSRRDVQSDCMSEYIAQLKCGDIIDARITHLEYFGAFADIGAGITSLLPVDAISVSRISHPRDRFKTGEDIKAVVGCIDENGRINLSHKELLGTWEQNAELFRAGETVSGIIRSVESYGVFVELTPNLAGLAEPYENAQVGQHASVYIKSLIPERMKIKLIIVDAFDADYSPPPLKYYLDSDSIAEWRYSPENCQKEVISKFY